MAEQPGGARVRPVTRARALTVAGSDSGGGAGIQADLKTFQARGVYGMSVITALTAQNTLGVRGVHEVPASFVRQQLDAVVDDIGVDALKTGMLSSAAIIEAVADGVGAHGLDVLVIDPVAASKHGDPLLRPEAVAALRDTLIPRALVVTPNAGEVELLTGVAVRRRGDQRDAAAAMLELGCRWVLIKGGHLPEDEPAADLLTDGDHVEEIVRPRVPTRGTHGTGCTLSAAIAAELALQVAGPDFQEEHGGRIDVPSAVRIAKDYLTAALHHPVQIGSGIPPVDHAFA